MSDSLYWAGAMKGSVVRGLYSMEAMTTGKALYLLSDLILAHAELGSVPCVTC